MMPWEMSSPQQMAMVLAPYFGPRESSSLPERCCWKAVVMESEIGLVSLGNMLGATLGARIDTGYYSRVPKGESVGGGQRIVLVGFVDVHKRNVRPGALGEPLV